MKQMTLSGKTVLITGASRGIGAATAQHLASLDANVVLIARSNDALKELAREIGPKAKAMVCDVSDLSQVNTAVNASVETFGSLDILINNAGILGPVDMLADISPNDWGEVIDTNVKGVFYMMHAAIPIMVAQKKGVIINVSSGAAYGVLEGWSHYCASKAAVLQLTRSGHEEYRDQGITCLGLSPGTVATEMQVAIKASGINPVSKLEITDHIPASDVAQAVSYLCGASGANYAGEDFQLKLPASRVAVGLSAR
jgi:NAD(P)-dependent dehydrogenase (short-subunit alcohol dehydrogenase family)